MKLEEFCRKDLFAVLILFGFCVLIFSSGCSVHPEAMDPAVVEEQADGDRETLVRDQEAVMGPISLAEAMARAVMYNRERSVSLMASALARAQMGQSSFDMWPELTADAGYTNRNNTMASESISVLSNTRSLESSTSTDDEREYADVSFAWNILDFGLSYVRAGQVADRYLMSRAYAGPPGTGSDGTGQAKISPCKRLPEDRNQNFRADEGYHQCTSPR